MDTLTDLKSRVLFFLFACVACFIAAALYFNLFVDRAYVKVGLEVSQKTDLKIYWAASGQPYSEENIAVTVAKPGKQSYLFFLTDLEGLERLRIDTHEYQGEVVLTSLIIEQEGYETITINSPEELKALQPGAQIASYKIDENGLQIVSSGVDSNYELLLDTHSKEFDWSWVALRLVVLCCVVTLICWFCRSLVTDLGFVPLLLFGIWMLILTMAGISSENVHPDEYVHLAAAQYYTDHWHPPALDDPVLDGTFSVYGVSRLTNGEVYYLFAGKFNSLMESFKLSDYLALRMFNVLLFGCIFFYTVKNLSARMVALPLLISPQIWYIFSYCTSDAFALFIAFIVACQLVDKKSLLHRYLKGDDWWSKAYGLVLLGILFGILFLLKKNYYPFIALVYFCLLGKLFFSGEFYWEKKKAILRLLAMSMLALSLTGAWFGVDYIVHGADRQEKIAALQEENAEEWYKPSNPLEKKHMYMQLKAKGATWQRLIEVDRWAEISFRSGFGVFGYFTISAPFIYYDLVRWSGLWLLSFFFLSVFLRGGIGGSTVAMAVLGLSLALIGVSFYHSWTVDFQPQGRYLLPIIPMLGIAYGMNSEAVYRPVLSISVVVMFLLSLYAFIFQGLLYIPKIVFG
jgi:hypothetical protein